MYSRVSYLGSREYLSLGRRRKKQWYSTSVCLCHQWLRRTTFTSNFNTYILQAIPHISSSRCTLHVERPVPCAAASVGITCWMACTLHSSLSGHHLLEGLYLAQLLRRQILKFSAHIFFYVVNINVTPFIPYSATVKSLCGIGSTFEESMYEYEKNTRVIVLRLWKQHLPKIVARCRPRSRFVLLQPQQSIELFETVV